MLAPLTRDKKISVWSDTDITPGTRWKEQIDEALSRATVAILLVTPNFLASDFIVNHELWPLLRKSKEGGMCILWIAVSDSLYKSTEIAHYQAANDPTKPLDTLTPAQINQTLVQICEKIRDAIT